MSLAENYEQLQPFGESWGLLGTVHWGSLTCSSWCEALPARHCIIHCSGGANTRAANTSLSSPMFMSVSPSGQVSCAKTTFLEWSNVHYLLLQKGPVIHTLIIRILTYPHAVFCMHATLLYIRKCGWKIQFLQMFGTPPDKASWPEKNHWLQFHT